MSLKNFIEKHNPSPFAIGKPFVIAEAGVNHEGSMDLAKRLISEAKEGGAQAIKFQTYKAETIASKNSPSYWDTSKESTKSQFELFKKYDKFWKSEYEELKRFCDDCEIEFLSTPFDKNSAIFLNDLMDVIKISSSDITNLPFIEFLCEFNKPILLSTGASFLWEVQEAMELIEKHNIPTCLMHCILNYPTNDENANLGMIKDLISKFPNCVPGYSDHTLPKQMDTLLVANLLGAVVLEKHFTHDKSLPGNDHYHAMDKDDLKLFFQRIQSNYGLIGDMKKHPLESESISRNNARRSLVASKNIERGDIITSDSLTWKRPAHGISPKYINQVIGSKASTDIKEDDVLTWQMID